MTPKEKAIELFDKFNKPDITHYPYVHNAQQCALIAVDELISGYEFDSLEIEHKRIMDNINFWDNVKQEIQKL